MELDRQHQISDLYHATLKRLPGDRSAFLTAACEGDDELRHEVESLMQFEAEAARFLETPAARVAAPAPLVGRQIGPYAIVAPLGVGGMGEVYRARDSKLGREVAIKILPAHFILDPERRARLTREARVLATLNHPHIGAIYGLEEADGNGALVLELVDGPTLAKRLESGPLRSTDAVAIARQIGEALDAAHEKGIIHRDLKPANIVLQEATIGSGPLSSNVRAKVLDFGLAKVLVADRDKDLTQNSLDPSDQAAGARILGTPAYMSPEQARGLAVDKRADIWAFGCVLFEMLTGRAPFTGATVTDTLARILDHEPDWSLVPAETPAAVRTLLERCLRKDPRRRLRDIADALIEIEDGDSKIASVSSARDTESSHPRANRSRRAWLVAGLVLGALTAGGLAFVSWPSSSGRTSSVELALMPPPGSRFSGPQLPFAVSPDGSQIVLVVNAGNARPVLWIRSIASGEVHLIPGTEGAESPFWAPDSRQVGFFADGKLKKVAVSGGAPTEICDALGGIRGSGGSWNREGHIVFMAMEGHLQKVSSNGGISTAVTALSGKETHHRWPWFLPDGQHFVFLAFGSDPPQLRLGSLASTGSTPVGSIRTNAVYASGHLLFLSDSLMAQPFDLRSLQLTGEPIPLNVRVVNSGSIFRGGMGLSASQTGLLVYLEPTRIDARLAWLDRGGSRVGTVVAPDINGDVGYPNLNLSPDDTKVVASWQDDIWTIDLNRNGDKRRIVSDAMPDHDPAWSQPDGKFIVFNSLRNNSGSLFRRPSDGSGRDELVADGKDVAGGYGAPDYSPDGSFVVFGGGGDIWLQSASSFSTPPVPLRTPARESNPAFSPSGRFVVYSSDRDGRPEIYVRPFPFGDREYKISRNGGWHPRWRREGEIFFLSLDGMMMSANVVDGQPAGQSIPQSLFVIPTRPLPLGLNNHPYDVTKDGQRFLMTVSNEALGQQPLTVVTNWMTKLSGR